MFSRKPNIEKDIGRGLVLFAQNRVSAWGSSLCETESDKCHGMMHLLPPHAFLGPCPLDFCPASPFTQGHGIGMEC